MVFLCFVLLAWPVHAATIFFDMALDGTRLTLINRGDGPVFYPAVLRMQHDGRWEPTPPPAGVVHAAELLPGASLELEWPSPSPQQQAFPLEKFRPVMVRFFDQAGTGFGQISFFTQPPSASTLIQAYYEDGLMTLVPPAGVAGAALRASWLLWPQEEGIVPLRAASAFEHMQPPARLIEWRTGMEPLRLDLGAALPMAMLLHETSDGFTLQTVAGGGVQGSQQRSSWLDAKDIFYKLGIGTGAATGILLLWLVARSWRTRRMR